MDVSRIEAISPKQIDWRKLTAPEIIEYKEQGIDVPSQYLQWAQGFLADVNAADTDDTTYEAANSQTVAPSAESAGTTTESTDATATEGEEGTEIQEEPKSPAEAKREEMEANDASLVDIDSIYGKVVLKIPKVGYLQKFISSPLGFVISILIPILLVVVYEVWRIKRMIKQQDSEIEIL